MTIEDELPYSAEIRAKHCEPDDEIDFGERYCTICGCVLSFDEEDICNDCLFESSRPLIVYPTEEEAQMWGVPRKVCIAEAKELSPNFRLVGSWETDKRNGVIVETDDGEQRLLSHEQYNDLMKARKSKGKKNETA